MATGLHGPMTGPMGLTLGDGAAGEVIVDDVAVGSMAAQLGLLPGAALVALNEVPVAGLKQKNEGDERRLLEELRAESMSKRMCQFQKNGSKWIIAAPESSDDEGTAEGSGDETGVGPAIGLDPNDPGRLRARTAALVHPIQGSITQRKQDATYLENANGS
ncbi:hypothetical protein Ctob_015836, partial [Chrysochromulina tobinii]